MAPLLPKLRGHFAEFLNNASSVGLRILSSSTCVGLRYGCGMNDSGFSRHTPFELPYLYFGRPTALRSVKGFSSSPGSPCSPGIPSPVSPRVCVPTFLSYRSTGISTCCPSTTALALALGPDLPRADQLDSGNLGYSA